jgi:hypothetical protein
MNATLELAPVSSAPDAALLGLASDIKGIARALGRVIQSTTAGRVSAAECIEIQKLEAQYDELVSGLLRGWFSERPTLAAKATSAEYLAAAANNAWKDGGCSLEARNTYARRAADTRGSVIDAIQAAYGVRLDLSRIDSFAKLAA